MQQLNLLLQACIGRRHACNIDPNVAAAANVRGLRSRLLEGCPDVGAVRRNVQHQAGFRQAHSAADLQEHGLNPQHCWSLNSIANCMLQ